MILKYKDGDLCTSYRPQTFSAIKGQTSIVKSLRHIVTSPNHSQCYLFSGESGCGKTTTARILSMALNCDSLEANGDPCCVCDSCKNISNKNHLDVHEINASSKNSINDIRQLEQDIKSRPLFGKVTVYILDEAHKLSTEAQNALLKDTEDMPKGVYIVLCSTEPSKIINTLRNRCETYNFKLLSYKEIKELVEVVGVYEDIYLTANVLDALVRASEFRPRNALKLLQQASNLMKDNVNIPEEEILTLFQFNDETDKNVIDLCKVLSSVQSKNISWDFIMKVYKSIEAEPETIRLTLAGWFRSSLERSTVDYQANKSAKVLSLFIDFLPPVKPENKLVLNLYNAYTILKMK